MSMWGPGIRSSDEFQDVYEEFFERYRDDADPEMLAKEIRAEYEAEFSGGAEDDPILFTMKYALALCLWECGKRDESLWKEIREIIDSGEDLRILSEAAADRSFLRRRKAALEQFWEKLSVPKEKTRRPKKTRKPPRPSLRKGDLFAYAISEGYRGVLTLDLLDGMYLVAISEEVFPEPPDWSRLGGAWTRTVYWATLRNLPMKAERIVTGHVETLPSYNNRAGLCWNPYPVSACTSFGEKAWLEDPTLARTEMERNQIRRYQFSELAEQDRLPMMFPQFKRPMPQHIL